MGKDRKGKEAAVNDTAEPAAGRMKRREGDAKSDLVLYKSMKRNEHNHPVMAKRGVENGRVLVEVVRSKEQACPGGRLSNIRRQAFRLTWDGKPRLLFGLRPRAFHVNQQATGFLCLDVKP